MITPNTPEELAEAHRQICYMRGINPETKLKPSPKLEVREKIESLLEQRAIESYDYDLHGVNFTKTIQLCNLALNGVLSSQC